MNTSNSSEPVKRYDIGTPVYRCYDPLVHLDGAFVRHEDFHMQTLQLQDLAATLRTTYDKFAERVALLEDALNWADRALKNDARHLPRHGSYGEEGVNLHQAAEKTVAVALALPAVFSPIPSSPVEASK